MFILNVTKKCDARSLLSNINSKRFNTVYTITSFNVIQFTMMKWNGSVRLFWKICCTLQLYLNCLLWNKDGLRQ